MAKLRKQIGRFLLSLAGTADAFTERLEVEADLLRVRIIDNVRAMREAEERHKNAPLGFPFCDGQPCAKCTDQSKTPPAPSCGAAADDDPSNHDGSELELGLVGEPIPEDPDMTSAIEILGSREWPGMEKLALHYAGMEDLLAFAQAKGVELGRLPNGRPDYRSLFVLLFAWANPNETPSAPGLAKTREPTAAQHATGSSS